MTTNKLSPGLITAIEEQQTAVLRLKALLECVALALDGSAPYEVEDTDAALQAVLDLARGIHKALDAGVIAERAAVLDAAEQPLPETPGQG